MSGNLAHFRLCMCPSTQSLKPPSNSINSYRIEGSHLVFFLFLFLWTITCFNKSKSSKKHRDLISILSPKKKSNWETESHFTRWRPIKPLTLLSSPSTTRGTLSLVPPHLSSLHVSFPPDLLAIFLTHLPFSLCLI